MDELLAGLERGERRAIARALTLVERGGPPARELADHVWPRTGGALRIGITGSPGVGKSTLVDALAGRWAAVGGAGPVGVLAVDPSSAFSRGALLGDRIRMQGAAASDRVFIRSMANRGRLGGLAPSTSEAADVLDACGYATIIFETVGVGQAEIEVAWESDVTVVVLAPGAGDGIQALKAGLMEIADVFCINKSDLPGADAVLRDVEGALELAEARHDDPPPVVAASAAGGSGVGELAEAIERVVASRRAGDGFRARRRQVVERRLLVAIAEQAQSAARDRLSRTQDVLEDVLERRMSVGRGAREIMEGI